jgi:hypothetical protein
MVLRRAATIALPLVATVWLAAAGGLARAAADARSQTYRGHGITFQYPTGWHRLAPGASTARAGNQLWTTWVGPARAMSADVVIVSAYRLPVAVTPRNLAAARPSIEAAVRQLVRQSGGRVLSGAARTRLGGLPAYRFRIRARAFGGRTVESRLVLAFRGRTEYFLNCQHQVGGSRARAIGAGCDRIVASFRTR